MWRPVGGISKVRILGIVALCAALAGCAASRQEVVARLGDEFIGQNVDALVVKFGPPTNTFKMNSGQNSYVWQLTAVTDIAADRGYGQAQTRFCKVSVIASPVGIVTQLNTEIRTQAPACMLPLGRSAAFAPTVSE